MLGETTINFIDRQVVSVLAPTLRAEFHLSNSYAPVFIGIGLLMPVALVAGFALMRKVEPVEGLH